MLGKKQYRAVMDGYMAWRRLCGAYRILVLTRQCSPSGRINLAQHSAEEQPVLEDVAAEQ